ncbi:hypothetical protein GYMLUDRAFT_120032, partial [Collybiopsis luxurians FD-317 M1]
SFDLVHGLAFLHQLGIAHLDVKPENLVSNPDGILQVIDFSVSVSAPTEDYRIWGFRGTVDWTAPEVGNKDGPVCCYSPRRADKWSCGAVL